MTKVKRKDQNQEILEALEKNGFKLKFGDACNAININMRAQKLKRYKIFYSGYNKKEGDTPQKPYLFDTKEEAMKATFERFKLSNKEPVYIRSAMMGEEEIQIREELFIVHDFMTGDYTIEYKDFKCRINTECIHDNQVIGYLKGEMDKSLLSILDQGRIFYKLGCRMGREKPPMETKYFTYLRIYSKLMENQL